MFMYKHDLLLDKRWSFDVAMACHSKAYVLTTMKL